MSFYAIYFNSVTKIVVLVLALSSTFLNLECRPNDVKLIGGRNVAGNEGLFMGSLQRSSDGQHVCGAAFYSSFRLITACSCIYEGAISTVARYTSRIPSDYQVTAGSRYNVKVDNEFIVVKVASLQVHPGCNVDEDTNMWVNDIGVIGLEEHLDQSSALKFIQYSSSQADYYEDLLRLTEDTSYWLKGDKQCYVFGWGHSTYDTVGKALPISPKSYLQTRALQFLAPDECQQLLCQVSDESCRFLPEQNNAFCAQSVEPGEGAFCYGDMGSPFVCDDILYGIASWNYECGITHKVNVIFKLDIPFMDGFKSSSQKSNTATSALLIILFLRIY
ncbi:trypsin alpha-like [Cimex lectularius]|uniref:Peptidase S1 domain-containing protein n=1 Tax=Cimex lectularius TaxID=79782 RepID=A0A8I6SE49_CIMLE|nr:trypsin alpha-like [Cimex lectularius]